MQFMDTHLHLQDFKDRCATDIINQGLNLGIDKFICASIIEDDWAKIAQLHQQFPDNIIPAFGLHPWYLKDSQPGWEHRLEAYLQEYPLALIGETGLDRHHDKNFDPQNSFFQTHIDLGLKFKRPLLIHAVHCQDWLETYWPKLTGRFVFHSYNGKIELLKKIIRHDGYISFSPSILQRKDSEMIVNAVPNNRLLIETDAPYQGQLSDIPFLVASINRYRKSDCTQQIYQNSKDFSNVK